MNEEEIIGNIKSILNDFLLSKLNGLSINDEYFEAIQGLLELYNKEKEKNKELEEKLKNEQISHKNDSDSMNEINEKITQDTVDCLKIIDKYRFCKVEKLKDFYKEIKEIFEGE